jgi:hypothetical protein
MLKSLTLLFLLTILLVLTSAQEHGSPNGSPPKNPNAVSPSINPNDVQFPSGVDPKHLSPPTPTPESTPGDLYVCTDANWGGSCQYIHALTHNCYNFVDPLLKSLTSIRPDKNQMCVFYSGVDCVGDTDWIRWPGSGNMRGRRFDNKVASWNCQDDDCNEGAPGGCTKNADGTLKGKDQNADNAKEWITK